MKYRNFGRKIHCLPIKWTSGLLRIVRCIPCSGNKGNIVIRNLTGKKEESKERKWNLFLDRINVNVYTSVYSGSNVEETSKPARGRGAKPWDRESYSETAAVILVNWDCPVWKCGNLVSTGRTFDPWATATHRACGPIVSRFTIESSSVPTRMSRNVVTTLGVSTLASNGPLLHTLCVPTTFPPSYPPLFISPSPLCASARTRWRTFDAGNDRAQFAPRAFYFKGTITFMPYRTVFTFAKRTIEFHCKIFTVSMELVDEGRTPVPSWLCDVTKIHITFPSELISAKAFASYIPASSRWNLWINNAVPVVFIEKRRLADSRCSAFYEFVQIDLPFEVAVVECV